MNAFRSARTPSGLALLLTVLSLALAASFVPASAFAAGGGTDPYMLGVCRIYDSQATDGPIEINPPDLEAIRTITVTGGVCGLPPDTRVVELNVKVLKATAAGQVSLSPGDITPPALPSTPSGFEALALAGLYFDPAFRGVNLRSTPMTVALAGDGTIKVAVRLGNQPAAGAYPLSVHLILDITAHYRDSAVAQDDAPPDIPTVLEDSAPTTIDVRANDLGPGGGGPFSIDSVTQPANGEVVITNSGADLTYEPDPDYCNSPGGTPDTFTYTLEPSPSTATVSMTVTCVNDAPAPSGGPFSVAENAANGTSVGTVAANDPDNPGAGQTHTWLITGGNTDGAFAIDNSGQITVANSAAVDFDTNPTFTLTVEATDVGNPTPNLPGSGSVTINVTNGNDAPAPSGGPFSIPENSANGTSVGTVAANDPDNPGAGQTHTWLITGGNTGGAFAIDNSGQITVANSAALNFETTPIFTLTVEATDVGNPTPNLSGTGSVTVNLTNVNEAPAPAGGPFSVAENTANGTNVGTPIAANDPDNPGAGQTHTWLITGGNTDGAFAINSSGQITVANSAALNFETTSTFTLTVEATDVGSPTPNLSGTGSVTVNLSNVNEAPAPTGGPFSIPENSANGTSVGTVAPNDPDNPGAGQTHTWLITGGNTGGAFAINSSGQITVANSAVVDFETNPTFTLTVQATDVGNPTPNLSGLGSVTVNLLNVPEAPIVTGETYSTIGNTLLEVHDTPSAPQPKVAVVGNLLANDVDPDGPTDLDASLNTATAGAVVTIDNETGTFTYVPPPGATGTDTFTYNVTDGALTSIGTVTINLQKMVWYVDNTANGGTVHTGTGTSANPFSTLSDGAGDAVANDAEDASAAVHIIYVFEGSGTTNQNQGITLKNQQKLHGEGIDLVVDPDDGGALPPVTLFTASGNEPQITNTAGNAVTVLANTANGDRIDIEIVGLSLSSTGPGANAVDVTSADNRNLRVTIRDNFVTGAPAEGIDVNQGSSGTATLAIHDNTVTATGAAVDIQRTAGTATISAFHDNIVTAASAGAGIVVIGSGGVVTFDASSTAGIQPVPGGTTMIGTPGDRIGGPGGLILTNVTGALNFANAASGTIGSGVLDIFTDTGAALDVSGGVGGFDFDVTPNAGDLLANAGPAAVISGADVNLQLNSLTSSTSSSGVSLTTVSGTFSAPSGSITKSSGGGTAFSVASSSVTVNYGGSLNVTSGAGVSLTSNTGSMSFSGGMTLSTGASAGFTATGGGTVTVTDPVGPTNNTITTTSGTALNVANTTIGASGLTFESISAGISGSPANGIFLSSTGSTGSLTVTGGSSTALGGDGSGGVIQNTTGSTGSTAGIGVYVNNARATLQRMNIHDHSNYGIFGGGSAVFNLEYSTVNSTATATSTNGDASIADDEEGSVAFEEWAGSGTITSSIIGDGFSNNLRVLNTNGADLNRLTVSNSRFDLNGQTAGNDQIHLESRNSGTTLNFTLTGSTVKGARADWFNASANSSSTMDTIITGNTFTNITPDNHPATVANGNRILVTANATHTFEVANNTLKGSLGNALAITGAAAGAVLTGDITNNDIGDAAVANSGSTGAGGISVQSGAGADITVLVDGNDVRQYNNHGIIFTLGDQMGSAATINATVRSNTINTPGTLLTDFNGFHVNSGTVSTDNLTSCFNIHDNNFTGGGKGSVAPNNSDLRLRQRQGTTIQLPGYTGPVRDTGDLDVAEVITYLRPAGSGGQKNNTFGTGNANSVSTGGGYVNSPGGAPCLTPP